MRQVHDAKLSDIEEDKDDHANASNRAPGKENDARAGLLKSREATSSMLKNRSFKTKTDSDTSSDGNVTIRKLKEMHLEADKTLNFGGKSGDGGARLSAGSSYRPPSAESASDCSSMVGRDAKTYRDSHCDTENLPQAGRKGDFEMRGAGFDTADKACQADISSSVRVRPRRPDAAPSPMAVHQSDSGSRPTTSGTEGSGVSYGFPSGTSRTSAASMRFRARRKPAETSTGSPPERDGLAADGNIGDSLRYQTFGSGAWDQQPARDGAPGLSSQGPFAGAPQFDGLAGGYGNGQKLTDIPMPPTPPREFHRPFPQQQYQRFDNDRYMMNQPGWASRSSSPSAPKTYGHSMGPGKPDGYGAHHGAGGSGPGFGAEYDTRPDDFSRPPNGFNSAAHFSDAHCRRDFSGDSYHDQENEGQHEYFKPLYRGGGFTQPPQGYQQGNQDEYGPNSQYGSQYQYGTQPQYSGQTQFGFQDQPGSWAEQNGGGFPQHGPAFEDDSYSAPKEFDFSFVNQGADSRLGTNTYVPSQEEMDAYMERRSRNPGPQTTTTPTPHAEPPWTIYEDHNDGATREHHPGCGPRAAAYAWHDGKTSLHNVSSSTPGNTVTILSIREITSDEDLSGKSDGGRGNDDDGMLPSPRNCS